MTGGKEPGPAEPGISIRMCVSALHTSEQIQAAIDAVRTVTEAAFEVAFGRQQNWKSFMKMMKLESKKLSKRRRSATPKRK